MGTLFGKPVYHDLLILYNSKVTIDVIRIGFKILLLLTRETNIGTEYLFFWLVQVDIADSTRTLNQLVVPNGK